MPGAGLICPDAGGSVVPLADHADDPAP